MTAMMPQPVKTLSDVAVVQCPEYDSGVLSAVRRSVNLLGGMSNFIKPGDVVLIKPNLLKAKPPQAAVTTHPEIVRSVIRLVHEADGRALVGDSPGMGDLRTVAEKSGILDVVNEEKAVLTSLDESVMVKSSGKFRRFEVARVAYESDAIINVPKLKTHGMTRLTGAIKNLFGCISGKRKAQWHFNTGINHELFMRMLVELYALLSPKLTIMDAIVGMEGNGPGSGDPRRIGAIIAGRDAASVDAVAAKLVGVEPEQLPLIKAAVAAGVGETRLDRIKILGKPIEHLAIADFRLPPTEHLEWPLPDWARSLLKNALTTKPVVNQTVCIRCGVCQEHCPQRAIEVRSNRLDIRYRECIRCFCCQELCPRGAITVSNGWALSYLHS